MATTDPLALEAWADWLNDPDSDPLTVMVVEELYEVNIP